MAYLVAGPLVAIIGIVAVFFVLRRKSVDQRSMYSARRSQIEHKVRAARQRTLTSHGQVERAPDAAPGAASPFDQVKVQPTVTYDVAAYQAPPAAPPPAPPASLPQRAPEPPPWEQAPLPQTPPAPSPVYPAAPPEPFTPAPVEPFRPAPEPTPMAPSEKSWTPAPRPAEPLVPAEAVTPAAPVAAASPTSAGGWSVVSTTKESALEGEPARKKKKDKNAPASDWSLASGEAPGMESDEADIRRPNGQIVAIAQYAVLVVGLVMVLIGVLVMVANSHVT
jgi:hypothetical protein